MEGQKISGSFSIYPLPNNKWRAMVIFGGETKYDAEHKDERRAKVRGLRAMKEACEFYTCKHLLQGNSKKRR